MRCRVAWREQQEEAWTHSPCTADGAGRPAASPCQGRTSSHSNLSSLSSSASPYSPPPPSTSLPLPCCSHRPGWPGLRYEQPGPSARVRGSLECAASWGVSLLRSESRRLHVSLVQARVQPHCPSAALREAAPQLREAEPVPGVFLSEETWKSLWGENENHL